jgi:cyclophilin family peptidyl-prolyl cis-trans isomerase
MKTDKQPQQTQSPPDAYVTDSSSKWIFPGVLPQEKISDKQVTIKTKKGSIIFELYDSDAPKTVSNFVYLAEGKYYDGLTFHRVEKGFVIQGGDPNGNGTGGPGYRFVDETVTKKYTEGIVAMANAGPNTNGSQFFIMLGNVPLPPLYTIFGKVTSGMDVVQKIQVGDKMETVIVGNRN